jgi:hypothetical protein
MRRADLDRDAAICKAMAADLNAYLLKDIIYWSLGDSGPRRTPYPQLTLGGLLMRLHHLEVLQQELSPGSYEMYAHSRDEAETAFASWRVQLERKLLAELKARTRTWSFFLADCAEATGGCADEYPTQAEVRTMIDLLFDRANGVRGVGQMQGQVRGLDRRLQSMAASTSFVWDPIFEAAYPRDPFWWLYISPANR